MNEARIGTDGSGADIGGEPRYARFGGVQVRVNPDGSLWIYQPDSNRLMGPELAEKLVFWLSLNVSINQMERGELVDLDVPASGTVPGGVIATSDGAVDPEADAAVAALNAGAELEPREWEPGEVEALGGDKVIEPSKPAPRRRGRPPRKA